VDDHRIAGLKRELLGSQRLLEILNRDLVLIGEHIYTFERRYIDHHASSH